MEILNIGILAHVDAGKTSLTERLLFNAGVIKTLGSVDQGNTQTDTLTLERQRGITIKAAVTSFRIGALKINLIDTPGHPDFIAEVERSLHVLDAVVLVISAVEGVQPQTRILMRVLQRLHIPTVIFVNKIDRVGARTDELIEEISSKFSIQAVAMNKAINSGTRQAQTVSITVDSPNITDIYPVYFGSAVLGAGVRELTEGLSRYFVPPKSQDDTLAASIFKIERGSHNEKIAYARIYSGKLQAHNRVSVGTLFASETVSNKITAMQKFENGASKDTAVADTGDIVKLWGLNDAVIGGYLGKPPLSEHQPRLTHPTLEVVVTPETPDRASELHKALEEISEQDPFIEVRQNPKDKKLSVRLCGEVQKEVLESTLDSEYGLTVAFEQTTTICIERPIGIGEGLEIGDKPDSYKGTVGIRIEPGTVGSGIQYKLARGVTGQMPHAFYTAIEESVHETLQGGIYGWEVTDCMVTLIKVAYWPRQSHAHARFDKSMSSTAGDFRSFLTPLALMQALKQARTQVYEPMNKFELELPSSALSKVMQKLVEVEAQLSNAPLPTGDSIRLEGLIPARTVFTFEQLLPDLTGGEGTFINEASEYQLVNGTLPIRERTDNNPLDRKEYLRQMLNRS